MQQRGAAETLVCYWYIIVLVWWHVYHWQVFHMEEQLSWSAREAQWWGPVQREHRAAREGVALFDLSSFGKMHVTGADAEAAMEWCASSAISNGTAPTGRVVYTQLLNEHGGVEADLTIVPLNADCSLPADAASGTLPDTSSAKEAKPRSFYIVSGSGNCIRDADHIRKASHERGLHDLEIEEVTDDWAVLALMGPQSRGIMEQAFPAVDFGNVSFPFSTAQHVGAGVRALRVSYVGELGWELHCLREAAPSVWAALHSAGVETGANNTDGLINAGYRALLLSLRVEKRFVHFGHDVSPSDSPLEASQSQHT